MATIRGSDSAGRFLANPAGRSATGPALFIFLQHINYIIILLKGFIKKLMIMSFTMLMRLLKKKYALARYKTNFSKLTIVSELQLALRTHDGH